MSTAKAGEPHTIKYTRNLIPIDAIYGYQEGRPTIEDHPQFPNPRRTPDRELVDAIKDNGTFDDEIELYRHKDGTIVILDGKSRMTAAAEFRTANEGTTSFTRVPFRWFTGTYLEARVQQLKRNLPERKSTLSDVEIALYIKGLVNDGLNAEEIKKMLGWIGKGGTRKYNAYMEVLEGNPAVLEKFVEGHITVSEAAAVLRDDSLDETAKAEAVEILVEEAKAGTPEPERRKKAGVAQVRATTMSYAAALDYMADILPDALRYMERDYQAGGEEERIKLLRDSKDIYAFLDERRTLYTLEVYFKYLKVEGCIRDKVVWLQSRMSEEQKIGMPRWIPPTDFRG